MSHPVLATFVAGFFIACGPAHALEINIGAGPNGYGCTTCFGGSNNSDVAPGTTVTLVNQGEPGPLQARFAAGTYVITNAATRGTFSAWNFEGYPGSPNWVWSFLIGADMGNNTATILKSDYVSGVSPTQAGMAALTGTSTYAYTTQLPATSTAGFSDTLTLATATTLDFFIDDGYLPDNGGGVALNIQPSGGGPTPVPEPATLLVLCSGLFGVALIRRRLQTPSREDAVGGVT